MKWWEYVDDIVFCQELTCMWKHLLGDTIVFRRDENVRLCEWCGLDEREISDHLEWTRIRSSFTTDF